MLGLKESKRRVAMLDAVREAERELEQARHFYLRSTGWEYTSATPGCLWLWQKETPKARDPREDKRHQAGRIMLLDTDTAFAMQRHWDDIELDDRAFAEGE